MREANGEKNNNLKSEEAERKRDTIFFKKRVYFIALVVFERRLAVVSLFQFSMLWNDFIFYDALITSDSFSQDLILRLSIFTIEIWTYI